MLLTPQLLNSLQRLTRENPLADDEFRRLEQMGSYYLPRGNLDYAKDDASFTALFSLKIDGDLYSLCYRTVED